MMGSTEGRKRKEVKRSDKYRDFLLFSSFSSSCHRAPDVDVRVNNAPLNVKGCRSEGKSDRERETTLSSWGTQEVSEPAS